MIKSIKHILLLILSLTHYISMSQMLSVQARLDTNIILIGDQVKLNLEVNQPSGFQLVFPMLHDTIVDKVEVLEDLGRDTIASENPDQILIRHQYLITSFDSGIYVFPPFEFTFQSYIDSSLDTITTPPTYMGVMTMALDTANPDAIADIKPPIKAPISFKEILPYALIGYFILFIISFLVYYFEKRKKNEPLFSRKPKPKEPAHIIAYRDLNKLKRDKLWQKNLIKKYHSDLTEIVRVYIEDRFLIPAMEQTSDEILDSFKKSQIIDSLLFDALRELLKLADLVKFAKAIPLADENEKCIKDAYMFIDRTKQVLITPEEEANEKPREEIGMNVKELNESNMQNSTDK